MEIKYRIKCSLTFDATNEYKQSLTTPEDRWTEMNWGAILRNITLRADF